jgi:hypothetical protein
VTLRAKEALSHADPATVVLVHEGGPEAGLIWQRELTRAQFANSARR